MRSQTERQNEVKPIIIKLKELHLNTTAYASIKTLYQQLQVYIQKGERIELNIPFPEYNVTIKGVLAIDETEQVWVKLERNDISYVSSAS
jgi:hypothetical protein